MTTALQTGKLGDLVTFKTGKLDSNAAVTDGDYPFFTCSQETLRTNTYSFDTECVLLAGNNANGIFPLKYFKGKFDAYQRTYVVRPRDANVLTTKFLYYALRLKLSEFRSFSTGAATKFLTLTILNETEIQAPPLPIQQRIAGILSAYDELIENCQRRIKILESMARALYREWFVHFRFPGHVNHPRVASPLGEIPQGWEVMKLGDISSYINRGITPRYDEEGDSVVINQKCVRDQRLSLEPARRQSKAIPTEKQVCFGDVLINSTGVGTLGRVAQVYENLEHCTVDTHVTIARAARDTDLDFYGCCLLSHQETFERLGIGATGQTELGRAAISEIELVAPPTDVQRQFGMVVKGMRSAAVTYSKQIQNLRRTRDLLLPRLLSGQIEVEAA
jgi:type I restriction enzyme S subunit